MTATPLVSVLMTAYNREKYIAEAIGSVLASGYTQFELIVVDDNSTDATISIATQFAAKDDRVKVYQNEKNIGDYPNRNRAASLASGKYLKYIDSDDYLYPWGLGLLVSLMESSAAAGWGLCSLSQDKRQPFPFLLGPREAYDYAYLGPGLFHKAPLSAIIRRSVFEEAGGFAPGRMVGDFELWHKLALKYPVLLMPEGMVWSREHSGQEVKSFNKFLPDYEEITIRYLRRNDCPLPRNEALSILKMIRKRSVRELAKAFARMDSDITFFWKAWRMHALQNKSAQ